MVNPFNFKKNHDFSLNFSCSTKYVGGNYGEFGDFRPKITVKTDNQELKFGIQRLNFSLYAIYKNIRSPKSSNCHQN